MNFKELLVQAKNGKEAAVVFILEMYNPLLIKNSIINGRFDEDLYQELCMTLLACIHSFRVCLLFFFVKKVVNAPFSAYRVLCRTK